MEQTGIIFDIQRFCIHDGPGIRSTVFLKGCPLSCLWCHNPESKLSRVQLSYNSRNCSSCGKCAAVCLNQVHDFSEGVHTLRYQDCKACGKCVQSCPNSALELIGRRANVDEILDVVMKDVDYYVCSGGGITISGGEPLFQPDFTQELAKAAKARNLHVCIETSGFCKAEVIEKIFPYVDRFLFDFKIGDCKQHIQYTRVSNQPILENLRLLDRKGAHVTLRCPIIPGINDNLTHFQYITQYSQLSCIDGVEIMAYHAMGADKAHKIGVSYEVTAETVSHELSMQWYEQLMMLGCQKILKP